VYGLGWAGARHLPGAYCVELVLRSFSPSLDTIGTCSHGGSSHGGRRLQALVLRWQTVTVLQRAVGTVLLSAVGVLTARCSSSGLGAVAGVRCWQQNMLLAGNNTRSVLATRHASNTIDNLINLSFSLSLSLSLSLIKERDRGRCRLCARRALMCSHDMRRPNHGKHH